MVDTQSEFFGFVFYFGSYLLLTSSIRPARTVFPELS